MKKHWMRINRVVMAISAMLMISACQAEESGVESTEAVTAQSSGNTEANTVSTGNSADVAAGDPVDVILSPIEQLALGTMMLEETADAVTPEQAAKLLPLWQLIQSGELGSDAEMDAVLKQIRATMTDTQLASINAVDQIASPAWYEERGVQMPAPDDAPEGGAGGMFGDMTEEERAAMREQFQTLTEEERTQMREEMGGTAPDGSATGGRGAAGMSAGTALVRPLVALLQQRVAE